jgi:L-alanine-DL-glutamate epimerase-like enolase superfamily enzyme
LAWLEEPVMADALRTPLVTGENHFTHHDMKRFFASNKIKTLQPDITRGGYTELFVVAEHAHRTGIGIAPHLFAELSSHLLAAIPNASWIEYMGWHDDL